MLLRLALSPEPVVISATASAPDSDPRTPSNNGSGCFDDVVEALGIGVFETSLAGQVVRCNEACARLFGFASPDALRLSTADIGTQVYVDPGRRIQQIARLLVEGRLNGFVARMRRGDGTMFWASETVRLITDPRTGERRLLGSITDVTEVVDQREALAAAERDYRSIFENATVGIFRTSVDGRQLRANRALWMLNGYESEAEMLADAGDIEREWYVEPTRRAEFEALIARDDRVVNFESEIHRYKTRERIWVRENAWAVRDAVGNLLFYEGIVEEITLERQAAELQRAQGTADRQLRELLLRSADRLRVFADIAADWYWESDGTGTITFMSEGIRRFGMTPAEFVGRTRDELPWSVDTRSEGFNEISDRVLLRESYKDITYSARMPDGTTAIISSSGEPHFDIAGAYIGYRGIGRDVTQQVAARNALARSEARFRDAIESMASGFAVWDANDRLIAYNRRVAELMPHLADCLTPGETFDTLRNRALRLTLPEASEADLEARRRRRDAQRAAESSFDMTLPDGKIIEVFDRRTSEGGFITVYRDVTLARQAMREIAASEALFRDAIDSMADGFSIWDDEDRLVAENKRVNEILPYLNNAPAQGCTFEEAFRSAAREAIPGVSDDEIESRFRKRLSTRLLGTTGELYLPGDRVVEVTDRRTSEGGFITVYRDVTETRATLQRLAESEARFRDFAETTADWFWEQDAALRFTYVSESNSKISGVTPKSHYGETRGEIKPLGVHDSDWVAHLGTLARREPFRDFRFERIDPTGRRRHLAISGTPLVGSDGAFQGYRGSGKDLTDLVETQHALEGALERANAATAQQRKFAETLAHEFRTPLTIIDGASQRLLRYADRLDPEELRTRVAKIRTAVRGMGTMIDTMLSSARLASGRLEAHMTSIDLVAFTETQIKRFDPSDTGRDFVLESDAPKRIITADEKLLEQIVANLLSNAIKYSGVSRRIDVSIAGHGDGAVLRVRDYGIGIPADEVSKLFTRFFRASTARSLPGTGIGLNLVHELVAMHGGTIGVESAVGQGTTFTVRLPVASGDSRSAEPPVT